MTKHNYWQYGTNFKINNSEIVPVDKTNATVIAYTNKIHDKTF